MDREEGHARVVVEHLLRPVAVMDVEIDDQDPVQFVPCQGIGGGDGHVPEQAEAHRGVLAGVMTGRPDQAHRTSILPGHDIGDRLDGRAGGEASGPRRAGADPGIGLDQAAAGPVEGRDMIHVQGRVDASQFFTGRLAHGSGLASLREAGAIQVPQDRLQPFRTLRVPGGRDVFEHPRVGVETDHPAILSAASSESRCGPRRGYGAPPPPVNRLEAFHVKPDSHGRPIVRPSFE